MRILVAVDQNPYSAYAMREVAKLAANTWANVSLLGVQPKNTSKGREPGTTSRFNGIEDPLSEALLTLRKDFLGFFRAEDCPYAPSESEVDMVQIRKGFWEDVSDSGEARKKLNLRIRVGNPVKEILSQAGEEESDLIVLGCDLSTGCSWESGAGIPRKVANNASCSVLVVKKEKKVQRMICCLDHDRVSQQSLEMINQMVTLHNARLVIVGIREENGLRAEVEKKIDNIMRYYQNLDMDPWIQMVELSSLDSFIAQEARWGLTALWMGKNSILEKALPRGKVNKLIKGSNSSVLILR